jgi:peptidoglycan/LPS O-acetylase OafA/YrhL
MRTIPSYLVALLAVSIIVYPIAIGDAGRYALYVQNLFAQHNVQDYYPVAWSLSVEEWFYLVFPACLILAVLAVRRTDARTITIATIGFILIVIVARFAFGDMSNWGESIRRVVAFRIDSIAFGFAAYIVLSTRGWLTMRGSGPLIGAIACTMIIATAAGQCTLSIADTGSALSKHLFFPLAAAFGVAAVYLFFIGDAVFPKRLDGLAVAFGAASYPIYLFHLPILMLLTDPMRDAPAWLELAVYLAVLIAFSALFHRIFEKPILRARPTYTKAD